MVAFEIQRVFWILSNGIKIWKKSISGKKFFNKKLEA